MTLVTCRSTARSSWRYTCRASAAAAAAVGMLRWLPLSIKGLDCCLQVVSRRARDQLGRRRRDGGPKERCFWSCRGQASVVGLLLG